MSLIGQFGVGFYSSFLVANKALCQCRSSLVGGEWDLSPLAAASLGLKHLSLHFRESGENGLMGSCCSVHATWQVEVYSKSFKKEGAGFGYRATLTIAFLEVAEFHGDACNS